MRIVVVGEVAVRVPEGASDWDAAMWVNPGILPDEFDAFELIDISLAEVRAVDE